MPAFFQLQDYNLNNTVLVIPEMGVVQGEPPPLVPHPASSALRRACTHWPGTLPTERAPHSPRRLAPCLCHFTAFRCFSRNAKRGAPHPQTQRSSPGARRGRARSPAPVRAPTGIPEPLAFQPSHAPPPGGGWVHRAAAWVGQGGPDGVPGMHTGEGTRKGRKPPCSGKSGHLTSKHLSL